MTARRPAEQQLPPPTGRQTAAGQRSRANGKPQSTRAPAESRPGGRTHWSRAIACVCFELAGPEISAGPWLPGPFPVPLPDGRVAGRMARATYFQARAADVLYGPDGGSTPCRWHRKAEGAQVGGDAVLGIELLRLPRFTTTQATSRAGAAASAAGRYLGVLHLALDRGNPVASLAAAVRLDPADPSCARRRELYAQLAGPGFRIPPAARRALAVTMLTSRDRLRPPPGSPEPWTATDGWLWTVASATPLQHFCPDTGDPDALAGTVYLSSSWRALVLRDGVGFLGLVPDRGDHASFFDWAESYIRSLYTDVTLLAALERDALDGFANHLAHIGNRFEKSQQYRRLVNEVTEFRNVFWWENITRHGNANQILERLHCAHGTSRLFSHVIDDLDAFRQQVEAQALEASLQVQATEEKRSRRFEHTASVAAIAITLPALVFTALALPIQGLTSDGHNLPPWLVIALGAGAMLAGAFTGAIGSRWISRRTPAKQASPHPAPARRRR